MNGKPDSEHESIGDEREKPWHKKRGVVGVLAVFVCFSTVVGAYTGANVVIEQIKLDIVTEFNDKQLLVATSADATRALEIAERLDAEIPFIRERALWGAEFRDCWPDLNCPENSGGLPVDEDQNRRLDILETAVSHHHSFFKLLCQGLRDILPDKFWKPDCSVL